VATCFFPSAQRIDTLSLSLHDTLYEALEPTNDMKISAVVILVLTATAVARRVVNLKVTRQRWPQPILTPHTLPHGAIPEPADGVSEKDGGCEVRDEHCGIKASDL
jgi:hypothetical protein